MEPKNADESAAATTGDLIFGSDEQSPQRLKGDGFEVQLDVSPKPSSSEKSMTVNVSLRLEISPPSEARLTVRALDEDEPKPPKPGLRATPKLKRS